MSIFDSTSLLIFSLILATCLGAVMGSFLNCVAWRIVHHESFLNGRSHCPICGHTLTAIELIPVISWLVQKGKCRNCKAKIPARYPLTELIFAIVTVLCLLHFQLTVECGRNYVFLCCLFVLTLTDLEDMIIPDGALITAAIAWVIALPFQFPGWHFVLMRGISAVALGAGMLGISLIMDKLLNKDTLGGGDIKLLAVVGLYLGLLNALFTLLIACILGLLIHGISTHKADKQEQDQPFPFGPSIAIATSVMLFCGNYVTQWYMGLFAL